MKQALLILTTILGLLSCNQPDKKILGSWDNKNGQILSFENEGKALWIFYTDTKKDTFEISYKIDYSITPNQLDLTDFKVGPLKGNTLYGIVEFQDNNTFRFDCEPSALNRPKTFNPTQTQVYYKQ